MSSRHFFAFFAAGSSATPSLALKSPTMRFSPSASGIFGSQFSSSFALEMSGFLLTSTSEVYGDPLQHPQTEEYWGNVNPIGERSCYDEGKRCAETLAFDYKREHGVEIRVARIFNTYGPRMALDDGRVVLSLIHI